MANTDNKCSELEVKDFHTGTEDTLGLIYNKQKELQERYGFDFKDWSVKRIVDFWMVNKHALGDEVNEMFDAIGGINDGIGSAGWKYWKGKMQVGMHQLGCALIGRQCMNIFGGNESAIST